MENDEFSGKRKDIKYRDVTSVCNERTPRSITTSHTVTVQEKPKRFVTLEATEQEPCD